MNICELNLNTHSFKSLMLLIFIFSSFLFSPSMFFFKNLYQHLVRNYFLEQYFVNKRTLKSQKKLMGESKEINQKWKRSKNFNIYFFPYSLVAIAKVLFLEGRCALDSTSNQLRDFSKAYVGRRLVR